MRALLRRLRYWIQSRPPAPLGSEARARREMIQAILACPGCGCPLAVSDLERSHACGTSIRLVDGVPVFTGAGERYFDRRHVDTATNPYSPKTVELIRRHPDALILDFGAGNPAPDEIFANVVRIDFVHYRSADVVATTANLPFRSETFDHVVSESVFEHVRDPVHYARELHRVLKPGGQIIVDSAFLQPLHGDPYHFFNMTLNGLEEVMKPFRKVRTGVEPYQSAGMAMNILRQQFLDLVVDPSARAELAKRVGDFDYCAYDRFLTAKGQRVMAAGVYFVGIKD